MSLTHLAVQTANVIHGNAGGNGNNRGGGGGGTINTEGLRGWALDNIVPLLFMVTGIFFIAGARKLRGSDVGTTAIISVVGLVFCVGSGLFLAIANALNGAAGG